MAATPEQVRRAIDQYVEAWTNNDRERLLAVFAEDATWEDPVGTPMFKGHDGISQFWDFAHQGEERSLTPRVEQIIACGNEGILRFVMQVRLAAKNQGLDLQVVDHFVLNDDGRVQTARAFWDESCVGVPEGMALFAPNMDEAHK